MGETQTLRAADVLMRALADRGVRQVFCLPGGGAMHLNDALACEDRLEPVVCHHEQACGIAAEANGRTSPAGFGVALVTTGPGATNVLTPLAGAWIESLPLLVISGQVKRADALRGRPLRQGGVQEVDIVSMARPVTKYAASIDRPEDVLRHLEEALWHMSTGRPGPVWLDVPLDVQAAPVDPARLEGFQPPAVADPVDWAAAMDHLEGLLASARRPVILAGHGVRISGAAEAFREVAQAWGIPCVFTWNASDLLPWDHALSVGRPGVVAARAPNFAVQNADCLISIGCRMDNVVTAYNPAGFAREARKVVVDVDAAEMARHPFAIDLPLVADAGRFLSEWAARPVKQQEAWTAWRHRCEDWKHRYPAYEGRHEADGPAMSHYAFVEALSELIPEDQLVITGSSGLAVEVFYTVFRNKAGQRMFLTSGLGAMGYGLPAAIGACLGAGRRPTYCIESDGSLMLNLQELSTLKALGLPVTLVLMNNQGYASIRNTQRNYFAGRYLGSGRDSGLLMPDFVDLAHAMGIPAEGVDTAEGLARALASSHATGPRLIDVRLRPEETLSPKAAALPQPDGSMLSMPLEDMSPLLPLETLRSEMIIPLSPQSLAARGA